MLIMKNIRVHSFIKKYLTTVSFFLFIIFLTQCRRGLPSGDPGNGGLMLPQNFEAVVVVDSLGGARHIAVNDNGDIYVKLRASYPDGSNVALRDEDNDGKADIIKKFSVYTDPYGYGTAMRINNGYLYYSSSNQVFRCKLKPGELLPDTTAELILTDDFFHDPYGFNHTAKPITFDDKDNMYVPYGAPSDVCQELDRIPGSPGQNPCPQLAEHAGIWVFNPNKKNQTIKDGKRYATGIRSAVAITWNPLDKTIYVVQHGRDDLHRTWPAQYSKWQSALLPSEEFLKVKEGADAGWPYYYYDWMQGKKLLNPEYGGDGKKEGDVPFGTLSALSESPLKFGLLYAGTDDGNVHISKDGGYNWKKISSKLPPGLWVSHIAPSKFKEGRVYITFNGYRNDHFLPYLFVSEDYGETWKAIGKDLPFEPLNVVKEDPKYDSILYVGSDGGLYVSVDAGNNFMTWNGGLPKSVPIHDIAIQERDNDIILGTHGRSLYVSKLDSVQLLLKDPEYHLKKKADADKMVAVATGEQYKDLYKREGIEVECPPLNEPKKKKK